MGRLFWKFFFFFWLAQLLTSIGVGIAVWSLRPDGRPMHERRGEPPPDFKPPPHAPEMPRPPWPLPPPPQPPGMPPRADLMRPLLPFLPPPMPLIAGSVVSLLFAALLAWYFSRPIRSLRSAFNAVAEGRLEARVGASMGRRRDELADLGGDFDRMADRLQSLIGAQRRLMHDVSHELRSPLARLQAAVGLLRQQPERSAELVERVERDTERMDHLVGELLTLARVETGMASQAMEAFDLADLLDSLADDAHFEVGTTACSLCVKVSRPLALRGNEILLHRALENVLRNALRHSPAKGEITLEAYVDPTSQSVVVSVTDQGPGIAEAECDRIFQPFYRGQGSTDGDGYGLGLAIVRGVVEMHGGSVQAANRAGGGLAVTIRLPTC